MEENVITSVQNARIKHVVALQQKSSLRREEGLFVVEGQREIERWRTTVDKGKQNKVQLSLELHTSCIPRNLNIC